MADRRFWPRTGRKHMLLFQWRVPDKDQMKREEFVRKVLMGALALKVEEIFCLQDNVADRGFELTLHSSKKCQEVTERFERHGGEELLKRWRCTNLDYTNYRLISVHMYNPHVSAETICTFMERYAQVVHPIEDSRDSFGIWNGTRLVRCLLKKDPGGYEGLAHPPAFFAIGADRGYLYYSRQPLFCKKCRGSGHKEEECKERGQRPKACHTCGADGHLHKDCPRRGGAGGGQIGSRMEKAGPSSPAGEGGQKRQGEKASAEAATGTGGGKEGKKVRKDGGSGDEMDTGGSGKEMTGGGVRRAEEETGGALSFASGRPAGLFGPPSPAPTEGTPTWAERVEEGDHVG